MTTRATALGLAALLLGFLTLFLGDGAAATVVGLGLLVPGAAISALAGLFGVRVADQQVADDAESRRDAGASAAMQGAMETGRWPRVIGGGG